MPRIAKNLYDAQTDWEWRLNRAKKVRKAWKDLFRVDLAKDYFDGRQNPGYPADEWITVNKIYAHLKAQLPSLYAVDPYFYVKLKRSFKPNPMDIVLMEQKGRVRQAYLNYLKEELELKDKVRLAIQDAHFAYGVIKIHYKADEIENPNAGEMMISREGEFLLSEEGESLLEPETIPINERYCITRIHPDDFLWDEDSSTLSDTWKWVAQRVRMTLEDAKKDRRFNKQALKALEGKAEKYGEEEKAREDRKKGGDVKGPSETGQKEAKKKIDDEIVALWETYYLKENKWSVYAEDGEIPLIYKESIPPGTEKHAYAILVFTRRDDSPYPIPPISQGIDPQKEYNLARSRILTHRKRFNRKYEAVLPQLTEDPDTELTKLESGGDGTIIKVTSPGAIVPISDAPLDQMGYLELNVLNQDLIELLGGSHDEARGIAGAESATQASILDKRLEIKEGDALSMVIDFTTTIARKLDQLVQTHITREEAVRISGPEGEMWELIRPDDYEAVEGEFQYSVNVGATVPRMPALERSQWMAFLALLGNFPHLLLSKHFLKRMAEMHHIEDDLLIEELMQIGKAIMGGQMPMPGQTGSQPGVGEQRPTSAAGGQAGGILSLLGGTGGQ